MAEKVAAWVGEAGGALLAVRSAGGGWPYRRGGAEAAEPTALAGLALLAASAMAPDPTPWRSAAVAAAGRLAALQRPDGSVGIAAGPDGPGWPTPLALLLWQAVGPASDRDRRALAWLRAARGETMSPGSDPSRIVGHDTTLVGWPWVEQTHSWLEPTAMAVLALERRGLSADPRVVEGRALLRDRAIETGGWNYGNRAAFGRPLRPQPGPTGLALLALAGAGRAPSPEIIRGLAYLRGVLPTLRAAASLGWAILGLRAWGEPTGLGDDDRLADASRASIGRADAPVKLAMLLLAAGPDALGIFGRGATTRPEGVHS